MKREEIKVGFAQSGLVYGGEMDCGPCHREDNMVIQVLIRKHGLRYKVHKHIFSPQQGEERVEHSGSLMDCINHVKKNYSHRDDFGEE